MPYLRSIWLWGHTDISSVCISVPVHSVCQSLTRLRLSQPVCVHHASWSFNHAKTHLTTFFMMEPDNDYMQNWSYSVPFLRHYNVTVSKQIYSILLKWHVMKRFPSFAKQEVTADRKCIFQIPYVTFSVIGRFMSSIGSSVNREKWYRTRCTVDTPKQVAI